MTTTHYPISRQRPELLEQHKPGEHVWVVVATFRVEQAATLHGWSHGEAVYLDAETLAAAGVVCFLCEEAWTAARTLEPCPGEPW